MKNLVILFLIVLMQSCAIFDGYKDNRHSWYKSSLSKDEKKRVRKEGKLIKEWHGVNKRGDYSIGKLLILKDSTSKRLAFAEIGPWRERHSVSGKNWNAIIIDTFYYDYKGNLMYQHTKIDELDAKDSQFFTYMTTSVIDSLNKVQIIKTFYDNGQLKLWEKFKMEEYSIPKSDYIKRKKLLEVKAFNEQGEHVEPWQINHWMWWSPTIKMKK